MRLIVFLALVSLLSACFKVDPSSKVADSQESLVKIPALTYDYTEVILDKNNNRWVHTYDSSKVSGYVVSRHLNGKVATSFGVVEGKKEGQSISYFSNGRVKFSETYRNNRLNGMVKRWTWTNGYQLVAQLEYKDGKLDGEQKKWYDTGELHKLMNLRAGREEGLQQAFRKNGAVYANYEARNGRVFGMKRSNLCYELDNEKVVYKQ